MKNLRSDAIALKRSIVELRCPFQAECSICLKEMDGKTVTHTACGHTFHTHCLKKWRLVKNTCPLCRNALPRRQRTIDLPWLVLLLQVSDNVPVSA
jgi:hypothetical protein